MEHPLNNLKKAAEHIRLSRDEKEVMRAKIFAAIDAAKYAPVPALRIRAMYSWVSLRYSLSVALVLLFAVGGGTAYAAEGALPGQVLYPVKVNVNEKVAEALAVTPEAKISFHASRAAERLKEAEALAAEGRLDATTTAQLEENFDSHLAQADELTQQLSESDEGAALEANVRLESSLSAHSDILARLGDESGDESTRENSSRVASRALAWNRADTAVAAPMALKAAGVSAKVSTLSVTTGDPAVDEGEDDEDTARASTTSVGLRVSGEEAATLAQEKTVDVPALARSLQVKAKKELDGAHDAFDDAQDSLSAAASAQIEDALDALDDEAATGTKQIEDGNFEGARDTFTDVLRGAVKLSALIEASDDFKHDFFFPRFGGGDKGNDDSSGVQKADSKGGLNF